MSRHKRARHLGRWLAILFATALGTGCASGAIGTPPEAKTPSAELSEAARTAARLEQQGLYAMLRRVTAASAAYRRMTEARDTLIDALSGVTVLPSGAVSDEAPPPPAPPSLGTAPRPSDPYEELEAATAPVLAPAPRAR